MSRWMNRVNGLFRPTAPPLKTDAPRKASARASATPAPSLVLPDLGVALFEWLLGSVSDAPITEAEARLLDHIDGVIASDKARGDLLPRAKAVIPQLLNSLRDENISSAALAAQMSKDVNLVTAAVRLANSASYAGAEPLSDLAQVIERVGLRGLRQVIAKVLLKPVFDSQAGGLSARAAARLWEHSECQARLGSVLAAEAGLDPFSGYLGGLLHNVGWTAALRAIDRHDEPPPARFTQAFMHAFFERRARLFGRLVAPWRLSDALTAVAEDIAALTPAKHPLHRVMQTADTLASMRLLDAAGVLGQPAALWVNAQSEALRAAYAAESD